MAEGAVHKWSFRARLRRDAYGWKSEPAIRSVKEAVSEIKKVARSERVLAAERAVLFLERVSPALASVDSSSGAIGTAVNNAVTSLDVLNAYSHTVKAAQHAGCADQTRQRIHDLVAGETPGDRFVTEVLRRQLGLS